MDDYNNKFQKERWLLRRYLFTLVRQDMVKFPLEIIQPVGTSAPDFIVVSEPKEQCVLELTEATHWRDARERRNLHAAPPGTIMMQGERGGRGKGGMVGDSPMRMFVADLVRAIRRKARKPYAANMHLLVYANSNATKLIFDVDEIREGIKKHFVPILDRWPKLRISCSVIFDFVLVHDVAGAVAFFPIEDVHESRAFNP